jgi:hypothetical protein
MEDIVQREAAYGQREEVMGQGLKDEAKKFFVLR